MQKSWFAIAFTASLFVIGGASALAQQPARQPSTRLAAASVPDDDLSIGDQSTEESGTGLVKIYSNLGPSKNLYNGGGGWIVAGPKDPYTNQQQDVAIPFTPAKDSTVTRIELPIQYYQYGTNNGTVELAADAAGLPGRLLAKHDVANLPVFGVGCCKLSVWNLQTGIQVTAGTQYWIIATTDQKSTDSAYVWDYNWNGTISSVGVQDNRTGWSVLTFLTSPAAAVLGTTP